MRILFWKFLSHYRYVLGKCEVLGKCNEYTCIPIPMNNHSQTRLNYCISSFPDAKKRIKMNIVFCHFLYQYQLKKIRSTWKKCIKAIAMTNYIQTRHKNCISSFSDSKKVKMSMKFFHFLCHYLLEGEKIKYLEKCIKPMCHENICMLYVNTFIHTHSVV